LKGLAVFAESVGKRYLFGCCSLTSQDPGDGWRAMEYSRRSGFLHPHFMIPARDPFACDRVSPVVSGGSSSFSLPKLFSSYMRFGAKVCSEPALDRDFKTIDFFVMLDLGSISAKTREIFLENC